MFLTFVFAFHDLYVCLFFFYFLLLLKYLQMTLQNYLTEFFHVSYLYYVVGVIRSECTAHMCALETDC